MAYWHSENGEIASNIPTMRFIRAFGTLRYNELTTNMVGLLSTLRSGAANSLRN
jgi:hypothetical protein